MHRSTFDFCVEAFPARALAFIALALSGASQDAAAVTVAGKTPGTFALSSTGAATYRVPIWSPQGVGDVQLDLALVYNSRTPNGLLGMGWSISGLSAITRCNKTWAQDGGAPQRVTLTLSDRFCLDGKQLKLVSGSYGQAGSIYATEIESFSKIVASGTSGNGPASFTVTTKNGLIYDYGITADSKIKPGGGTTIQTWALSRIRDRVVANNGNKIAFTYTNDTTNNTYRIASIAFPTTASGQGPFYEVLFSYSGPRAAVDTPSGYSAGYAWREPNRLSTITIRNYGSPTSTKTYTLTYNAATTGRSRLAWIEECSGQSNCLAKTFVSYQSGTPGWAASTTTSINNVSTAPGVNPIPVDLNSDGLTDLFYPKVQTSSSSRWYAAIASASGFGTPIDTGIITPNSTHEFVGSFDGLGQQQLMMQLGGYWNVVSFNGTSFTTTSSGVPVNGEYASVDYDGDGLSDLASVVGNDIRVRRNITAPPGSVTFAGTATTVFTYTGTWSIAAGVTSRMSQVDFDGNGRGDLYFTTHMSTGFPGGGMIRGEVLYSNGFGTSATHMQLFSPGTPRPGDWNLDGCSDIIGGHVYLSNCSGGFTVLSSAGCAGAATCMVGDWEGDGRSDVLYTANDYWYVKRSTGEGVAAAAATGIPAPLGTQWFVFDKDGDGLMDAGYIDTTANNVIRYRLHLGATVPADLATSLTDGYGINFSPTYVTISRSNYTKEANSDFPEQDFKGPFYVVGELEASDGTGGTYTQTMHYWGGVLHLQGRGFEGFRARRVIDSRHALYDYAYFARTFPHTGMLTAQTLRQGSSGPDVSKWTSVLGSQNLGPAGIQRRYFPFLSSITQSEYELGGTFDGDLMAQKTVAYTYGDTFGNPTLVVTSTIDKDPGSPFYNDTWQTTVDTIYQNDTASNCLGLPDRAEITSAVPGQATETRTYEYANDTTLCRTFQEVIEPDIPELKVTTTLAFDPSCANVQTITVVGSNPSGTAMPARTTTLDFGTRCQLPISLKNALNETTTFAYLYDFGVLSALTDPNGFLTSYEFDDFGRRTREDRPDGTSTVWTYTRCATPPCWGAADLRLRVTEDYHRTTDASFNTRQLHYDGMERLRTDETNRVLGVWTINAMTYDPLGRVATKYHPYTSGTSADNYFRWIYDDIGRVNEIRLYRGGSILDRTTTLGYAGRTTTVDDNLGRETSYVHDVAERLRRVIDPAPGGTTKYDYDAFGNLKKITDPILAVSQGTYNLRGFRTQWQDADRGTWNFTANSLNELVAWTNARAQSFSMEYDLLGRLRKRYDNGQLSEFIWGNSAASGNIGQLKSKSGGGYLEEFFYDGVGRLSNRRITTDQVYNFDFTYNNIGALNTVTYPVSPTPTGETVTRLRVQYLYSFGHPYRISDVTHTGQFFTIWDLTDTNPFSSPTAETLGPSLISVRSTYKAWTNELTSMTAGVSGSTTNRQNLSYAWNTVGNLTQRQDLNQGLTEAFSYDAIDRFASSTLNGVLNLDVDYDPTGSGNIQFKTGVGTYAYNDPNRPHAVTAAGSFTFEYDNNGNVKTRNGLAQTWTSFDLPATLQADVGGSVYSSQFSYGPDHQRWKQVATYWNGTETTHYVGGLLEKASTSGVTLWRHYVPTPSGLTIVVSRNSDNTKSTSYVLSDHLGSSDAILDEFGAVITRLSFDAFGARRGSNWLAATPPDWPGIAETTRRGFTFHEMLDNINLIHMNGRSYDPVVGRFMSVDPVIGDIADGQSANPFSYVGNRPLNRIDPTGLDVVCGGVCTAVIGSIVSSALSHLFGGLFGGGPPPPPPASAWPGTSAQNGVNVCDPGLSSPSCGGSLIVGFGPMTGRILEGSPGAPTGTCAECHHGDIGELLAGLLKNALDSTIYAAIYYVESGGTSGQLARIIVGAPDNAHAVASQWIVFGRPDTNLGEFGYDLGPAIPVLITGGRTYVVVRAAAARAPVVLGQPGTRSVDPRRLISRQGPGEMSGSRVKRLRREMRQGGFDPSKPIDVADVDGRLVILDGHHRARAAVQAGIREVPVRVQQVTREQADQLMREAAEAAMRQH